MTTIFDEIKESLDVNKDDTAFDTELTLLLSTTFSILSQLGVHNIGEFDYDREKTWDDYKGSCQSGDFNLIKTYVLLKVRLAFDPPTASTLTYVKEAVSELERRIKESFTGDYTYEDL